MAACLTKAGTSQGGRWRSGRNRLGRRLTCVLHMIMPHLCPKFRAWYPDFPTRSLSVRLCFDRRGPGSTDLGHPGMSEWGCRLSARAGENFTTAHAANRTPQRDNNRGTNRIALAEIPATWGRADAANCRGGDRGREGAKPGSTPEEGVQGSPIPSTSRLNWLRYQHFRAIHGNDRLRRGRVHNHAGVNQTCES